MSEAVPMQNPHWRELTAGKRGENNQESCY